MAQIEHIPETHSLYSPSGSSRWMKCPGSIKLIKELNIKSTFSKYADYGSGAHELAAKCLKDRSKHPKEFLGQKVFKGIKVDQEMVHGVEEYIDHVLSFVNQDSKLYVEKEVRLDHLFPNTKGTADIILIKDKDKEIHIMDLKFGKGVAVEAEENFQLMLYAIGSVLGLIKANYNIDNTYQIFLHIFQPRCPHPEGPARIWETDIEHLKSHSKAARKAIDAAQLNDPPLVPGKEQCKWCEAAGVCKPLAEFNMQLAIKDFENMAEHNKDFDFKDINVLNDKEINSILQQTAQMKNWIGSITAHVQNELEKGRDFDDWKLVRGRSNRKWETDEHEVIVEHLTEIDLEVEDLFTKKLKSPTQVEKMVSKDIYRTHVASKVIKPLGNITIAPKSDKREAVKMNTAVDDFAHLAHKD